MGWKEGRRGGGGRDGGDRWGGRQGEVCEELETTAGVCGCYGNRLDFHPPSHRLVYGLYCSDVNLGADHSSGVQVPAVVSRYGTVPSITALTICDPLEGWWDC